MDLRTILTSAEVLVTTLGSIQPDDTASVMLPNGTTHTVSVIGATVLRTSTLPCGEAEFEVKMTHSEQEAAEWLAAFRMVAAGWSPAETGRHAMPEVPSPFGIVII